LEIKQKTILEVKKDGKTIQLIVDADLSLGLIFDSLMEMKGWTADRMIKAHLEEQAEADEKMGAPEQEQKEEIKE